jgi:hypothetical protein
MDNKTQLLLVALLAATSIISGCASVPMASDQKDAEAKAFRVQPGKSNIYVYRNESMGGAVKMEVDVDGKQAGTTAAKTYLVVSVNPGQHTLVSHAEGNNSLVVDTQSGKNHFVWQEVKMGVLYAGSKLQLVDEQTGKAGVGECKLIEVNYMK